MADISNYKRIHCLGIGGIGLSAIAEILENMGHEVTGTDIKESEVTEHLKSKGIKIFIDHKAENVEGADAIVYSAAISDENPEIVRAKELGIPIFSRAEVLGMLMDRHKNSVAVCGTHGKTTVTSMTSLILRNAGYNPTILVGGIVPDIKGNVEIGGTDYFVTEACEYMDSFLSLRPTVGVILNIDSDHLDYFKDLNHIVTSFKTFVSQIPENGTVVAFDGNMLVKEAVSGFPNVIYYGYNENCDFYAKNISFNEMGHPTYDIYYRGEKLCTVHLNVPGEHNVLNSMAAFAATSYLGADTEVILSTLESFAGAQRRFDYAGKMSSGAKIIDDYAHHPTEIKATLAAAKNVKHDRILTVFQPHTYTRTKALFNEFMEAFDNTDVLILTDIYAAREKDIYNVSSYKLACAMQEKYPDREIYYIKDFEDIAKYLNENTGSGDIVITMGAGDVYKVGEMLLQDSDGR